MKSSFKSDEGILSQTSKNWEHSLMADVHCKKHEYKFKDLKITVQNKSTVRCLTIHSRNVIIKKIVAKLEKDMDYLDPSSMASGYWIWCIYLKNFWKFLSKLTGLQCDQAISFLDIWPRALQTFYAKTCKHMFIEALW